MHETDAYMAPVKKILIGMALLMGCAYGLFSFFAPPLSKPNILVVMVDDLGFNDLAINNDNADMDTPNMDQIAREGVRFTRHYAAAVCSPARAAFLTGMYPERMGYTPNGPGISPDIMTLPERLQEEGYTTWHIGKWHIGDLLRTAWPDHQGFDHWFGFLNQWRLAGKHVDGDLVLTTPRYNNPWLQGDSESGRFFPGHLENILTVKALEVISALHAAQAPWFINLWFYAPHAPVQPAPEFAQLYPDTPAGRYRALVNQLDTNIGRILSHMRSIGALDNTIVVIVSDNGGTNKELDNNAPYTGYKTRLEEGGLRTPLIIRWPDNLLEGQVYPHTVSIEDIYPTLLAAIGVEPPQELDGHSFYKSISGLEPPLQREQFRESARESYGVLSADGRWRLYRPPTLWGVDFEPRLSDLEKDPYGAHQVVPAPPAQVAQMIDSYKAWYREVHTVKTDFSPDGRGGGILRGTDFLRTPGIGSYTFGIAIPDQFSGQIAAQEGIWNLSRSADTVEVQVGPLVLAGDIDKKSRCHSIVISGLFQRKIASTSGPDLMSLALYIDGREVASEELAATLAVPDPTIETMIGDPDNVTRAITLGPPVILNTRLDASSPWTLDAFSQSLCEST